VVFKVGEVVGIFLEVMISWLFIVKELKFGVVCLV